MANLNVIYRIASDISGLQAGVNKVADSTGKLETYASRIGKAFTLAFSFTAITALAKQVIDFGSDLVDLSAKTGISTDGLQKLQLAFEQNGVSLETVTTNVTKLAKALIDGDKSTVGALTKLGLSIADLKKMNPEEQFIQVADAIGKIENPTEKAWAAMQIFGRGGAELLKGLTGNLKETTEEFDRMGLIVSGETLQAADRFGDQLMLMGRQLLGLVATIVGPLLPALSALMNAFMQITKAVVDLAGPVLKSIIGGFLQASITVDNFVIGILESVEKIPWLGKQLGIVSKATDFFRRDAERAQAMLDRLTASTDNTGKAAQAATPALLGLGKANEAGEKSAKKFREELEKHTDAIHELEAGFFGLTKEVMLFANGEVEAVKQMVLVRTAIEDLERKSHVAAFGFKGMADGLDQIGEHVRPVIEDLHALFGALGDIGPEQEIVIRPTFGDFLKQDLGKLILGAFQGGGNVAKTIGAGIGGFLTSGASAIGAKLGGLMGPQGAIGKLLGKGLGSGIGGVIGSTLGSIIPGLGTLLGGLMGPMISKLGGALKRMFGGPSKEELGGRDASKAFGDLVSGALTATQRAEAGGQKWKEVVIGVRDAYIRAGRSAAEAEQMVAKLWAAEKRGPEAVKAVQEEITAVMDEAKKRVASTGKAVEDALSGIGDVAGALPERFRGPLEKLAEMGGISRDLLEGLFEDQGVDVERMKKLAADYGIELAALGPQFASADLNERAGRIITDFEKLKSSGADAGGVLAGMSDEISQLVVDARKAGLALPENLRPMIDVLIQSGQLLDENGQKITDINSLTFGDPIVAGMDKIVERLDALLKGLGIDLPAATERGVDAAVEDARRLAGELDRIPDADVGVNVHYNDPGFRPRPADDMNVDVPRDEQRAVGDEFSAGATGGLVTARGIQRFAMGGMVRPRGTDSVPALLTPGEMILTRAQQQAVLAASGDTFVHHWHIQALDSADVRAAVTKPGGISDLFIEDISRKKRGRDQKLTRAMAT